MKLKIFLSLMIVIMVLGAARAQDNDKTETAEFKVDGVCSMCKARIENAALMHGVKFAEWTVDSKVLKVVYRPDKVSLMDIHHAVADAGHDTDEVKATDKAYQKLPPCCAYRDDIKKH